MEFWEELEIKVELYRNNRKEMIMNDILEFCCKYLKTCAMNSYNKAKNTSVYIPFEDFYSQYLLCFWEGICDYIELEGFTLKNILLRRLFIAERKVWRMYKKISNSKEDKNQTSYNSTRWQTLEFDFDSIDIKSFRMEEDLILNEAFENYCKNNRKNAELIYLLFIGYSPSEAVELLDISNTYDAKTRKKVQRIKESFIRFL